MKTFDVTVTRSSWQTKRMIITAKTEEAAVKKAENLKDDGDWDFHDGGEDIVVVEVLPGTVHKKETDDDDDSET